MRRIPAERSPFCTTARPSVTLGHRSQRVVARSQPLRILDKADGRLPAAGRRDGNNVLVEDDETARVDRIEAGVAGVRLAEDIVEAQVVSQHAHGKPFLLAFAAVEHVNSDSVDHAETARARIIAQRRHWLDRLAVDGPAQHGIVAVQPPPLADRDHRLALFTDKPQVDHELLRARRGCGPRAGGRSFRLRWRHPGNTVQSHLPRHFA